MSVGFSFSHFSCCYFCLLLVVLLFHLCLSNDNNIHDDVLCMDDERQALLDLKYALVDEANRLASWVCEKDCCTWTGIVCDNITGHVHSIRLRATYQIDEYTTIEEHKQASSLRLRGEVSPSLLNLKQLKYLDLSGNDFEGIQVPRFMGSLGSLRYLNLSRSRFGGTVPLQLGNLTKLRTLCLGRFYEDVYEDEYTSMISMRWLSSLRWLHHLDLSGVDLSKAIDWLEVINTLPSLVELHLCSSKLLHIHPHVSSLNLTSLSLLDLSRNHFNDNFVPRWIFSITSLVSLDLSWCDLQGSIPSSIHSFRNLTSLKLLHVPGNDFMSSSLTLEGLSTIGSNLISLDISSCGVPSSILDSLQNLTSIHVLQMSRNQLTKPIPKSLGNLCNLLHIDMGENDFSSITLTILLDSFWECKSPSLESLSFYSSELSCILPDQLGQLTYLVQLQLGNNRINGTIPDLIGKLSFLRSLDLGGNLISGPILFSIGGLSSLEFLDLSNNQLNGNLPHSLGQLSMLNTLDVSSNLLTGVVTEAHFAKLTNLKYLLGSGNKLTLRPSMANWIPPFKLRFLCLSSWDLGPQFPLWLLLQEDLFHLEISNTLIPSNLPETFWRSFPNLRYLDMSQNQIEGRLLGIPETLWMINLSSNKFSGQLPELSNRSSTTMLYLSNNSFVGSLHHLLCPYGDKTFESLGTLESLDLANNHLSGVIPECWIRWPFLVYLRLDNNDLFGEIPRTLGSLYSLRSLNVCNNKLSGSLTVSLRNLTNLQILQLSGNELDGRVPAWLGREFSSLRILNLRSNHFTGHVNDELCHLTTLQILDLADNNLSGKKLP
ncbi:hypothetical protein OSB04_026697 [Centaurea solstitialis]|uniref:Uncharacterized protein n=1 Tax=Centaurea solstitialis TaxID=347529 RepID=A0AA38SPF6_9ASTR|nr:hypothetical protein OSB04_026697 [Centaurea solstitialis]